jgi:hypothetical protein
MSQMAGAPLVLVLIGTFCLFSIPGYVIGKRREVKNPWVAFVPGFGFWIVFLESIGKSGWWALVLLVPYGGSLGLVLLTGWEAPVRHERSRWWRVALIVPGVNVLAYWVYAFTLEDSATAGSYAY